MRFILLSFFSLAFVEIQAQKKVDILAKDSAKFYVEYADYKGYINDSTFTSVIHSSLFLGKEAAVYIYRTSTPEEFLNKFREGGVSWGEVNIDDVISNLKKTYDIEKVVSEIYVRYYTMPDYLYLKKRDAGDIWLSDTVIYHWNLTDKFKIIQGYKCQQATINTDDGSKIVAWFTEDIPISAGPLYLHGLPGLILEYENLKSQRVFKALVISSTNIPDQYFRKWLKGPILTRKEYTEIYNNDSKKIEQLMRMSQIGDKKNER